jgi:hypothetical protein
MRFHDWLRELDFNPVQAESCWWRPIPLLNHFCRGGQLDHPSLTAQPNNSWRCVQEFLHPVELLHLPVSSCLKLLQLSTLQDDCWNKEWSSDWKTILLPRHYNSWHNSCQCLQTQYSVGILLHNVFICVYNTEISFSFFFLRGRWQYWGFNSGPYAASDSITWDMSPTEISSCFPTQIFLQSLLLFLWGCSPSLS